MSVPVWKILARYEVDGEEEVLDFTTDEQYANRRVGELQDLYGHYAVIRKSLESEDD